MSAIDAANAWRGGCLQCFAQAEEAATETLLALNAVEARGGDVRLEAEANRFSALLLMPPQILREELRKIRQPKVTDIVRLSDLFDVSKDAMAISYVEHSRHPVAVVVARNGRVLRSYHDTGNFPWISVSNGQPVPAGSTCHDGFLPGAVSDIEECDPELWFSERDAGMVDIFTEQVLGQRDGYSLILTYCRIEGRGRR